MKKQILFYIIGSLLLTAALLVGCTKNDGSIPVNLTRVPTPLVTKAGGDAAIDLTNLGAFKGTFSVGLYFPNDTKPAKFDVVVMKNGNTSNVKVFKADVTIFPTVLDITASDFVTLFGNPIALGDNYDVGVDVYTQAGLKLDAFPATGSAYASGVFAQPGASTTVRYSAICKYDPDIYQGDFEVVTDEWADYNSGDILTLTKIDETHFSFKYLADNPEPIIVTVDPNTNVVTVAKQVYGSGYGAGWPYGNLSVQSVPSVDNVVAPCDGTFSIFLDHTVAAGDFGNYRITLKKV